MGRRKEPTGWKSFKTMDEALKYMKERDMAQNDEEKAPKKVTDIEAAEENIKAAVMAFADQWMPWPNFDIGVEVMDVGRLRDAMGLRASIDIGDPWPSAEKRLLDLGFRWQMMGGQRVMYLKEKDDFEPDTGWQEAKEYNDNENSD